MTEKKPLTFIVSLLLGPLYLFAYNYGEKIDLPGAVTALWPDKPDVLASAAADLDGDGSLDYALILQTRETGNNVIGFARANPAVVPVGDPGKDVPMARELVIVVNRGGRYSVAVRSRRAVLGSACGVEGEDPFLALRARTKTFTILHKFHDGNETWGTASRFRYSAEDRTWRLDYFYGHEDAELGPKDFGRIGLEDFDLGYYLAVGVLARSATDAKAAAVERYPDDILFTEDGVAFTVRPDGSNRRYLAGDRFFRTLSFPCWSVDKKRIAFVRRNDLYVADADGTHERRLLWNIMGAVAYDYRGRSRVDTMRSAPDGVRFAWSGESDTAGRGAMRLYAADTGGNAKLLKEADAKHPIDSLCWSPDSKQLAYYYGTALTVLDLASGSERILSEKPGAGIAWSTDGKRIITAVKGAYDIIDIENGSIREILCLAWAGYGPLFWSSDEQYALYYSSDDILMMPLKTGGRGRIVIGKRYGLIDGLSW